MVYEPRIRGVARIRVVYEARVRAVYAPGTYSDVPKFRPHKSVKATLVGKPMVRP